MSDPHPPRPDQPFWVTPSPPLAQVPSSAPARQGRLPALMAAAFVIAGLVFAFGLPVIGRIGGANTQVHVNLPNRKVDRASFPEPATSPRLTLQVNIVGTYSDCTTHTSGTKGVYLSNCGDSESADYHAEIFKLGLVNNTDQPIPWALDQFVLQSGSGPGVSPLPPSSSTSLPESGTLAPHDFTQGFVAFDTGDGYVPQSVDYVDDEILAVDVSAP